VKGKKKKKKKKKNLKNSFTQAKRETKLLSVLSYISSTMWKSMFGKAAELERSTASEHEYMIVE
jgi:hypothetical protein